MQKTQLPDKQRWMDSIDRARKSVKGLSIIKFAKLAGSNHTTYHQAKKGDCTYDLLESYENTMIEILYGE